MPSALVLLPAALLLAGALVALLPGPAGRYAGAAAAWAGASATAVLWAQSHGSLELSAGSLGAGTPISLRLDSIAAVTSIAALVPGAAILTWRPGHASTRLVALAAAQLALSSADLALTALAAGAAAAFAAEHEDLRQAWTIWAGVLAAALAGAALQTFGGTATYGAAPASTLNPGIAGLVLLAAALLTGAVPLPAWPRQAWRTRSLILLVALPPVGVCLLLRLYVLGDGRLPDAAVNEVLAGWAVLVMLAAAWRAQAASQVDGVFVETVPELAAFGLLAAAAGGVLGGVSLALLALSLGVVVMLLALADGRDRRHALAAAALVAGVPATLAFGARLLALQALIEDQPGAAVWALPAAAAWLLWMLACIRLPGLVARTVSTSMRPVAGVAAVSLLGGAGLGVLVSQVALPVARDAGLASIGPPPATGLAALNPVSGGWPAVAAALTAVLLGAAAIALRTGVKLRRLEPPLPEPPGWPARVTKIRASLPAASFERALSGSRPVVWGVLVAALAVIATRSGP